MRLPALKKLLQEDFKEQGSWIGSLLNPINTFLTTVSNGLSNGLTVRENMLAQIKTVLVSGANPSTSFAYPYATKPIGCLVLNITESNGTPAFTPPIKWVYSAGQSLITVNGLEITKTYNITFYVIGG